MNDDDSKNPVSHLVREQALESTEEADELASKAPERPTKSIIFHVASAGKWKHVAIANYAIMYFLMLGTVIGDTLGLWEIKIDQAVLATFVGATIGSTIPLYLQFSIGKKLSQDAVKS